MSHRSWHHRKEYQCENDQGPDNDRADESVVNDREARDCIDHEHEHVHGCLHRSIHVNLEQSLLVVDCCMDYSHMDCDNAIEVPCNRPEVEAREPMDLP